MLPTNLLNNQRLIVSPNPPYDPLQAFVRENHIALKGAEEGPLAGLTFAAKDVFKILGSTVGNGHPDWLRTHQPDDFTASTIVKLLDAGADLVGKTICDELCFSISGENWNYGSPLNPHDVRRYTGGSSAGSGAAVAGGLADFALGSDCLGSVRIPGSFNGVFGIRPSYGRVPSDGEARYCPSMDVFGYLVNDPEVFRRVSRVMLGEDRKPFTFRKLLVAKDCFETVSAQVYEALKPAIAFVGSHLESVEEITLAPEGLAAWLRVFQLVQGFEVWESYGGWVNHYRPRLSRGPKERLEWASTITRKAYKDALARKAEISAQIRETIGEDALLALPTAASVATLRTAALDDINAIRQQASYLLCISPLSGTPQFGLPMAFQDGLPLGLSLIGPNDSDLALAEFSADAVRGIRAQA